MRVIAVTNQKGGVGKTTSTVNLAAALAAKGKKVIMIDLDPQAHLTTFLGISPFKLELSSYELLCQNKKLSECLVDIRENIRVLGSGINLTAAEQELVSVVGRETILRDAIAEYDEPCDYVFIDCPPSLGMLTLNALGAAKEIFIPMQPHFLSLQGLSQLLESVTLVQRRINPELEVSGIVFCMFDSRLSLSNEVVSEIESFVEQHRESPCPWQKIRIFDTRVRRNVKLAESPSYGQTIFEYEKSSNGAEDYMALCEEVILMEGGDNLAGQKVKAAVPEPEVQVEPEQATPQEEAAAAETVAQETAVSESVQEQRAVETGGGEEAVNEIRELPADNAQVSVQEQWSVSENTGMGENNQL